MPENTPKNNHGIALAGLLLSIGMIATGYIASEAAKNISSSGRYVTVKGLSEREVIADVASWRIPFRATNENRETAMNDALSAQDKIIAFASSNGFESTETRPEPFSITAQKNQRQLQNGYYEHYTIYTVAGAIRIRSKNVTGIQDLTTKTADLLRQGIFIGEEYGSMPSAEYNYLSINKIKPEMIAEATRNARAAAQKFAEDSGQSVESIKTASQGAVQIIARDGGYSEETELHKKVRVVSTVTYFLGD